MARKSRVEIDINKFRCVKILLESKTPIKEIMEFTQLSEMSIYRIKAAKNFEEFKHNRMVAAIATKNREAQKKAEKLLNIQIERQEIVEQQEEKKPKETAIPAATSITNNYQLNRLVEIIKEQNEILKIMSNKIAFIVDELTK